MSDEKPKKKKGIGKMLGIICGALALAGASAAGGYIFGGKSATHDKDDTSGQAGKGKGSAKNPSHASTESPEDDKPDSEKKSYLPFEKDFTSNLVEQERFVQLSLTLSFGETKEGEPPIKEHEAALRSAVLAVLADQSAIDLATATGKNRLRIILRNAVNDAIEGIDGSRPVDEVLFTNFIIQ